MRPTVPGVLAAAALAVLLVVFGALQYRWIGQVAEAERQRIRTSLSVGSARVAEDLDREVTRAFLHFQARLGEGTQGDLALDLVGRLRRWREEAPYPELVKDVFLVVAGSSGGSELARLDSETGATVRGALSPPLEALARRLGGERDRRTVEDQVPALLLRGLDLGPEPVAAVVELDQTLLLEQLIPELVERHLGGVGVNVAVVLSRDPGAVLFRSVPTAPVDPRRADVAVGILGLGRFPELPAIAGPGTGFGRWMRRGGPGAQAGGHELRHHGRPGDPSGGEGAWTLLVSCRAGSLEAAVTALRFRNLAVAAGTLVLLAASVALVLVAGRRAQRLARQQVELVAGVSHELKTPLAAIRSVAQNLADGIVSDDDRVRQYGAALAREERRLSGMVGELLDLAGMGSGRPMTRQAVAVEPLVATVLEDARPALAESGVEVETDLEPGLPPLLGDPALLRRALHNLLDNAIRHGGSARWVKVGARRGPGGGGGFVTLSVADRGEGIPRSDLPHLFEPFFRGRGGAALVSGSGLGLTVVRRVAEQHGGRVSVESGRSGSTFTLHLPAAPEQEEAV